MGSPGGVATVLWLDYDSPQRLVPAAARRGAATDAATRLAPFLDAVASVDRELVTVLGHSYGSVVLGRSLADTPGRLAADRLVALGSPGLGVQVSAELALRADQRLYAATFDEDPIAFAGRWHPLTGDVGRAIHGPDPGRLRAARSITLSTHDLPDGGPVERHLQYLAPGSSALRTLAEVAAGGEDASRG
jgi:pimeloyl-ACP methyl ester carboxylesterase